MGEKDYKVNHVCSICGKSYKGFGNNAWPINDGRCCDECNMLVIAERIKKLYAEEN